MVTPTPYSQRVADRVRDAIASADETITSVSASSGIARMTLTRRLTGAPFLVSEVEAIAGVLGIDPSDLLLDSHEPATARAARRSAKAFTLTNMKAERTRRVASRKAQLRDDKAGRS